MRLPLAPVQTESMTSRRWISRLERVDWDFTGTFSDSPFSLIHWHPGRLVSQVAATLVGLLTEREDIVLDPFSGSGTVLVEAQRLGRRSIGFELNPTSCRITKSKTLAVATTAIERAATEIIEDAEWALDERLGGAAIPPVVPESVQRKWYTRRVLSDLGTLWALICSYSGVQRLIAEVCLSAILLPSCRETRHWGYVCDNSTPKDDHSPNVRRLFVEAVERLAEAYQARDAERVATTASPEVPLSVIRLGDARELAGTLEDHCIDAVITSPPYFGVSDYAKSQRLSMEWFGTEIEPLRLLEIGARSKRHRKSAAADYVRELSDFFMSLKAKLKADGRCALVIGKSHTRQLVVDELVRRLENSGYTVCFDATRRVSEQRRQSPSVREERIIVCRVE